jgi:hypothetical protein
MMTQPIGAESIGLDFVPRSRETVASVELDGEAVLYDEETGEAHVLSPTATVVWFCCDGGGTIEEISKDIAEAFATDPGAVREDVLRVVREFGGLGLLDGVERAAKEEEHDHHEH